MIGPSLPARSQASYDRIHQRAASYYRPWAVRIQAERESRKLVDSIPDEMLNDLSDSEDEMMMAMRQHAPTPPSMPSSPTLCSIPKPTKAGVSPSLHGAVSVIGIEKRQQEQPCWRHGGYSPNSTDEESVESTSWKSSSRPRLHYSRRSSDLVESISSSAVLTKSKVGSRSKRMQLARGGSSDGSTTSSRMRQFSSRRQHRPSYSRTSSGPDLRVIKQGRIAKRRHFST